MNNATFELELIVISRMLERLFFDLRSLFTFVSCLFLQPSGGLFSLETFLSVRQHIQNKRELTVIIDLNSDHSIEVKLEPFKHQE